MATVHGAYYFTDEEIEMIEADLYEGYIPRLTVEDTIGTMQVNPGVVSITRNKIEGLTDPEKMDDSSYFPKDVISRTSETKYVEPSGIGFDITNKARKIAAYNNDRIESLYIQSVGRRIAESVEDEALSYFNDIAESNSRTFDAVNDGSGDWTSSDANPYNDMLDIISMFDEEGTELTHMWVNNKLYRSTQKKDENGDRYIDDIEGLGVTLLPSRRISNNTGIAIDANECQYVYSNDLTMESQYKPMEQLHENVAYIEGVPDILSYRDVVKATLSG